jgi:hypothetical protein
MLDCLGMAGGAHATSVYRTSCTLGYAGCRRSLFHHHSYMYYQKTIHVGKAPIDLATIEHSAQGVNGHKKHRGVWKYFNT